MTGLTERLAALVGLRASPTEPMRASDLSIEQPERIRRLLLAVCERGESIELHHRHADRPARTRIVRVDASVLHVACDAALNAPAGTAVNVSVATARGMLLFTLVLDRGARDARVWSAALPREIVCHQSRAARRVRVAGSDRVGWSGPPWLTRARIVDVSEGGAGLLVSEALSVGRVRIEGASLALDARRINVPRAAVVRCTPVNLQRWHCGLQWDGVDGRSMQLLRLWLNEAEVRQPQRAEI